LVSQEPTRVPWPGGSPQRSFGRDLSRQIRECRTALERVSQHAGEWLGSSSNVSALRARECGILAGGQRIRRQRVPIRPPLGGDGEEVPQTVGLRQRCL
jgi:hypothetical protein